MKITKFQRNLNQLKNSVKERSPDSWTVRQFIDFKIKEFGIDADVLLPNGENAPDEMTLGELRRLYGNIST
jgi:hypothetical protein